MKKAIEQDADFTESIFTKDEIIYCMQFKNHGERFAARYAAKEAFLKAIGTGWRDGISFKDIEIINDELGKPSIRISGKAKEITDKLGISDIHVSLSHTKALANAFVILEKLA